MLGCQGVLQDALIENYEKRSVLDIFVTIYAKNEIVIIVHTIIACFV